MADILNLSFGCGNTLLADQLNQIVLAINQLANQNGAQRGITLNTNTRELSITNNSSTADLDSILPYGIKDGGSWDDFITFYRDSNNNHEVDINGSGGRQCDLGVTGNIRTGLSNEYSYVRTDILLLKDGRNDSYIGKLYSSNGNLYYLYVDGSGQETKYYPPLLITRAKSISLETGRPTGFELNVDIPQNQLLGTVSSIRIGGELDGNTLSYSNSYIAPTDGDNNPTIPQASDNNFGVIKLGYTLNDYDYPVELDSDGRAYVTVNWNSSEKKLEDLMPKYAIGGSSTPIYWNGGAFDVCDMNISGITSIALGSPSTMASVDGNGTANIPAAGDNSYGIVKLGYTSNSSYYGVLKDLSDKLYVDLSDVSLPTIGTNDSIGDVLAIIQGDNDTKKIGWAQLSPNGVAGVREIKYGYYAGNTLNYAQIATSNQTFKLIPGNNITFDTDDYNYPNSLFINASVGNVKLKDLYDVDDYSTGYLKYENDALVWTNVSPGSPTVSITDGTPSDDNQKTLSANTKYKLTVGESSYVFTTPPGGVTSNITDVIDNGMVNSVAGGTYYRNYKLKTSGGTATGTGIKINTLPPSVDSQDNILTFKNGFVLNGTNGASIIFPNILSTNKISLVNTAASGNTGSGKIAYLEYNGNKINIDTYTSISAQDHETAGTAKLYLNGTEIGTGGSGLTGIKYQNTGGSATTITPSSGYVTLKAGNNVSFDNSSTGTLEISASGTNGGGISNVTVAGTSVVSNGTATIGKASNTAFGVIKVDGTTITANNGVISATGGSGNGDITGVTVDGLGLLARKMTDDTTDANYTYNHHVTVPSGNVQVKIDNSEILNRNSLLSLVSTLLEALSSILTSDYGLFTSAGYNSTLNKFVFSLPKKIPQNTTLTNGYYYYDNYLSYGNIIFCVELSKIYVCVTNSYNNAAIYASNGVDLGAIISDPATVASDISLILYQDHNTSVTYQSTRIIPNGTQIIGFIKD